MGVSPISDVVLMGWTLSSNIFSESIPATSASVKRTFSKSRHICSDLRIEGANGNRSLAVKGVDKEWPVRGQPAYREDEKARRTLTPSNPNRIAVYI